MNEICGDNRFEIIERAKKDMLDATNIDTSPKEMEVLDNFLFRCWQMGWLDRYDTADTPQTDCPFKDVPCSCGEQDECEWHTELDIPQTDCGWGEPNEADT